MIGYKYLDINDHAYYHATSSPKRIQATACVPFVMNSLQPLSVPCFLPSFLSGLAETISDLEREVYLPIWKRNSWEAQKRIKGLTAKNSDGPIWTMHYCWMKLHSALFFTISGVAFHLVWIGKSVPLCASSLTTMKCGTQTGQIERWVHKPFVPYPNPRSVFSVLPRSLNKYYKQSRSWWTNCNELFVFDHYQFLFQLLLWHCVYGLFWNDLQHEKIDPWPPPTTTASAAKSSTCTNMDVLSDWYLTRQRVQRDKGLWQPLIKKTALFWLTYGQWTVCQKRAKPLFKLCFSTRSH